MVRKCKCSGGCCGSQTDGVSRREFLTLIGAGAATAALGGQAWAEWLQNQASPEELERWAQNLAIHHDQSSSAAIDTPGANG